MGIPRVGFDRALKRLYDVIDGVLNPANDGDAFIGTKASVTGLTVTEDGFGPLRRTTFHFSNMAVALVDEAGVVAYKGTKLYDFPAGLTLVHGAVLDTVVTKSSAGVDLDWAGFVGVGTVTATNNNTLASTEQDIIPTTATTASAGSSTQKAHNIADIAPIAAGLTTDNDLFLNYLVADADHDVTSTPCNLIVNGTLVVHWMNLGNH